MLFSFLWRHIKPYKWLYLIMLIAPFVASLYSFSYNYSIKLFLDIMSKDTNLTYSAVLFPVILFLVTQVVLEIVWRISNIAEWKAEPKVRRSILVNSFDYVQHHSYAYFQDNFTGTITTKLKGLLDGYDKFWAEMHHGLFQKMLKIIVSLLALSFVNIYIGVFMLAWVIIYTPVIYVFSKRLNNLAFLESESRYALGGILSDNITNIISLFSFASRNREKKNLDMRITSDFIPRQVQVYKYTFKIQIIGGIFYNIMFSFILFYMLYLRINGLVTVGDFAFVFGMTLVAVEDIWNVTISLQEFTRAMGDFKSCLSILKLQHVNVDKKQAKYLVVKKPSIEFLNVWFGYDPDKFIFKNLSLKILPGEKVGVVGSSGSGKSTLVNLLMRYFQISRGEILIDNQNIDDVTQDSLRTNIAIIPQDTMLFHRTLMENIRYGNFEATDEAVFDAARRAHIHAYIESLPEAYQTEVGERGIKLSGGQRQRIAIARAILKDAPILILDEATSALDSQTEKQIQESLEFLIRDKQKTVIAIAHRLSTLKHMDRIIVLDNGVIVEEGRHDKLIKNPDSLYKRLWEYQEMIQ